MAGLKVALVLPVLVAVAALIFTKIPIEFEPEPMVYNFAPNTIHQRQLYEKNVFPNVSSAPFDAAEILLDGQVIGPEDLVVSPDGEKAFMSMLNGKIVYLTQDDTPARKVTLHDFASTGGRGLNMVFVKAELFEKFVAQLPKPVEYFPGERVMLVTDAIKGLLLFDASGKSVPVVNSLDGQPLLIVNAAVVLPSGDVYMTHSTQDFGIHDILPGCVQRTRTGRLLHFDPKKNVTTVVVSDLGFPNGIVLTKDKKAVLIALTFQSKIIRVSIDTKKPKVEDFAYLPGLPDNLWIGPAGNSKKPVLFVGLAGLPKWWSKHLIDPPMLRKLYLMVLPLKEMAELITGPEAFVTVDFETGNVLHAYEDRSRAVTGTASGVVGFHDDYYVMSWNRKSLVRFPKTALA